MTTPYVDPDSIAVIGFGDEVPSSWFSTVRDNQEFFARPPGVQAVRTANQSIPNATWTSIQFTAADTRDTDNFHDTSNQPEQFVVPTGLGGWYSVLFLAQFASNSSGLRGQRIQVNGATVIPGGNYNPPTSGQETRLSLADEILLTAGDVITLDVYQSSGGSLNVTGARATLRLVALP